MGKSSDLFISIVKCHRHTTQFLEVKDIETGSFSTLALKNQLKLATNWFEFNGFVLISKTMSRNYDWFLPSYY
jgi:hypothetical protein